MLQRWNFPLSELHPMVLALLLGTMLSRIATSMTVPFFTIYLLTQTSASPLQVGLTVGAASLAGMLFSFVGGALSDRWGRKRVMLLSLGLWFLVFLLMAYTVNPWCFAVLNFANGLCKASFEPASAALISDITPVRHRYQAYSYRYTAANIGVTLGPLLGALGGFSGGSQAFLITGAAYLLYGLALVLLFRIYPLLPEVPTLAGQPEPNRIRISDAWRRMGTDRRLLWFLAGGILMQFAYSQVTTLSPYVTEHYENGVTLFAGLMTANAITVILCQLPLSALMRAASPLLSISIGSTLYAVGGLGFAAADKPWEWIAAMVVFSLGEVFCFPSGTVLMDRIAPPRLKGAYLGAQQFKELGRFLGPTVGLPVLMHYGIGPLFGLVAIVCLGSTVFFGLGNRHVSSAEKRHESAVS